MPFGLSLLQEFVFILELFCQEEIRNGLLKREFRKELKLILFSLVESRKVSLAALRTKKTISESQFMQFITLRRKKLNYKILCLIDLNSLEYTTEEALKKDI